MFRPSRRSGDLCARERAVDNAANRGRSTSLSRGGSEKGAGRDPEARGSIDSATEGKIKRCDTRSFQGSFAAVSRLALFVRLRLVSSSSGRHAWNRRSSVPFPEETQAERSRRFGRINGDSSMILIEPAIFSRISRSFPWTDDGGWRFARNCTSPRASIEVLRRV